MSEPRGPYFLIANNSQQSSSLYPIPTPQRIQFMQPMNLYHPHIYSTPPPDYAQFIPSKIYPSSNIPSFPVQFKNPIQPIPLRAQTYEHAPPSQTSGDSSTIINPSQIGLIPHDFWRKFTSCTFQQLVETYFHKRNSSPYRFTFKLYNALVLTEKYPSLLPLIGVTWQTNKVIKIFKTPFSRLIGTRVADNSLFHKQGNFPTHGFQELTSEEAMAQNIDIRQIDFDEVRLLIHLDDKFYRHCGEKVINSCIWMRNYNPI